MGHAMGAASQLGNRGRNYSKNNNIFNEICSINLQFRFGIYKLDENVLVYIVLVALENKEHTKSTQRAFKVASIYIPRKQTKID